MHKMASANKDRHAWLKPALAGAGHRQKDVATAWGVDDAVVSRFIKIGEPELTWDRAQTLARMLGLSLDELKLRLFEGLPPQGTGRPVAPTPRIAAVKDAAPETNDVMRELNAAVIGAIRALGVKGIKVVLDYGETGEQRS